MSHSLLEKRQGHGHGVVTEPTGYWKPARPAPYGNLEIPQCIGEENCDYWDTYLIQHERHILLMYITWGIIAFMVVVAGFISIYRRNANKAKVPQPVAATVKDEERTSTPASGSTFRAWTAACRHHLLPQSFFGMTRLQGLLFLLLVVYAILFTFIGIAYREWVNPTTPPGRRIGFNQFGGDRTGCLAFAFVPLVFILGTRDNFFSLITGISYQNFNFLHRWVGRWIFIFTFVHTLLWSVELGFMFQPQPQRYKTTWNKRYWKWGVGAATLVTYLFVHSFSVVRRWTGYEFFRKTHELIAVLFLGACWGHWPEMREWMIAGIVIVFLDRFVRYGRIFFIHMNWTSSERGAFGLRSFEGTISRFRDEEDNVDILILRLPKATVKYHAGQHFFLTFPTLSLFESHPFTPASMGGNEETGPFHEQLYIIRVCNGQTKKLAKHCKEPGVEYPMPTVCSGPYGSSSVLDQGAENVQLVSGGTGVSFTLPLAMKIVAQAKKSQQTATKRVDFVWIVRRGKNVDWIREELEKLKNDAHELSNVDLHIRIFVTREGRHVPKHANPADTTNTSSTSLPGEKVEEKTQESSIEKELAITDIPSSSSVSSGSSSNDLTEPLSSSSAEQKTDWLQDHHPKIGEIIKKFWEERCVRGRVHVLASGPPSMAAELRTVIAECNVPQMVKRGEERGEVGFHWDAREY